MENLARQHGPAAYTILFLGIVGSLINNIGPHDFTTLTVSPNWCNTYYPKALEKATLLAKRQEPTNINNHWQTTNIAIYNKRPKLATTSSTTTTTPTTTTTDAYGPTPPAPELPLEDGVNVTFADYASQLEGNATDRATAEAAEAAAAARAHVPFTINFTSQNLDGSLSTVNTVIPVPVPATLLPITTTTTLTVSTTTAFATITSTAFASSGGNDEANEPVAMPTRRAAAEASAEFKSMPSAINYAALAIALLAPILPLLVNFKVAWFTTYMMAIKKKVHSATAAAADAAPIQRNRQAAATFQFPPSAANGGVGHEGKDLVHEAEEEASTKKTFFKEFTKFGLLKAHFLGQAIMYAVSEGMRRLMLVPNNEFFVKCNATLSECIVKSTKKVLFMVEPSMDTPYVTLQEELPWVKLANKSLDHVLCVNKTSTSFELFNDLHSFPNVYCGLLGAGCISYLAFAIFYYYKIRNKRFFGCFSSILDTLLTVGHILMSVFLLIFLHHLHQANQLIQCWALTMGALFQIVILATVFNFNTRKIKDYNAAETVVVSARPRANENASSPLLLNDKQKNEQEMTDLCMTATRGNMTTAATHPPSMNPYLGNVYIIDKHSGLFKHAPEIEKYAQDVAEGPPPKNKAQDEKDIDYVD